jgi:hypothetical protein
MRTVATETVHMPDVRPDSPETTRSECNKTQRVSVARRVEAREGTLRTFMRFCGVYDTIMERMQDIRNAHVDTGCCCGEHPIRQVAWGFWEVCHRRSTQGYAPFTLILLTNCKRRHSGRLSWGRGLCLFFDPPNLPLRARLGGQRPRLRESSQKLARPQLTRNATTSVTATTRPVNG